MKGKKFDKSCLKMTPEELQAHIHFRKMGSVVKSTKGKGSYNRQEFKKGVDK